MNWFIYILIFIFGLSIGSFINAFVFRFKNNLSISKARSICPKCKKQLKWQHNIPLLSFIFLYGKCAYCKQKISSQYPIVELITGILFLISFINVLNNFNELLSNYFVILVIFYWIVISFLIIIFLYDLKYMLIPDKISITAIVVIFILQGILILFKNDFSLLITHYSLLLLSAIIISSFFLLQFLISKGKWIGGGDIRLGFLMGIILGWPLGLVALFLSYIIGSLTAIPLLIIKNKTLKSEIAFGTFLCTATLIVLFWGQNILNWYIGLIS